MPGDVLRIAEQNALSRTEPSFYTGSGQSGGRQKTKTKIKKGSKVAIIAILLILGGGGVFLSSTEALLPGALEANVTEETDSQAASSTKRGLIIMSNMLQNGFKPEAETEANARVTTEPESWTSRYDYLTDYMAKRFEANNIEVSEDGRTLTWRGNTITSSNLQSIYYSDPEFRNDYTNATLGRVANYYDTSAVTSYTKSSNSRNVFNKYVQTNNSDKDSTEFMNTVNEKFDGNETDSAFRQKNAEYHEETCTETDENGEEYSWVCETWYEMVEDDIVATTLVNPGTSRDSAQSQADDFISTDKGKIGRVSEHLNWACTALQTSKMIASAIASNSTYETMNYFLSYMENVSKMKAGYGSESGINETLNKLTQRTTATVVDYDSVKWTPDYTEQIIEWPHYKIDKDGNKTELEPLKEYRHIVNPTTFDTYTVDGSMLDSVGMQVLLAGADNVGTAKAIVQGAKDYEIDALNNVLDRIFEPIINNPEFFSECNLDKPTDKKETFDIYRSIGAVIDTGITGALGGFIAKKTEDFINTVLTSFLAFMSPTIATFLFTSIPETLTGVDGGNYWAAGASVANSYWLGRNASGQMPASQEAVVAYNYENRELLALEAEVDRINRSPLDVTSKNTFLGSIVHSLLPIAARSTITNGFTTLTSLASKSIGSLMGRVSAEGEGTSFMTLFGECASASKIGASCNMYGISTSTTDTSTINLSTDDSAYLDAISSQVDNEGNVDPNGDLAKYISYCVNRTSPLGKIDTNILREIKANDGNPLINFLRRAPIVTRIFDAIDTFTGVEDEWIKWANGTYCVNNTSIDPETGEVYNDKWEEEIKYYQRYYEDIRKLDQLGAFGDDGIPTLAYQAQYEAAHPWTTDNSVTGYLARIAGISKDDAELILDVVDYYNFLGSYDPDTRLALSEDTNQIKSSTETLDDIRSAKIWIEHEDREDVPVLADRAIYADVRNRSYAV